MNKIILSLLSTFGLMTAAHAGSVHCYTVVTQTLSYGSHSNTQTFTYDDILGSDENYAVLGFLLGIQCKNLAEQHGRAYTSPVVGPPANSMHVSAHAYMGAGDSVESIVRTGNYMDYGVVFNYSR